ncbi:MAG: glycerophosphodiester phosphodiesterase family protein [Propionicimonas sp.]
MPAPVVTGVPEVVYQSQSDPAAMGFARPTGLQDGDVLVAWLRSQSTGWASDWTPPAGFSRIGPAFASNSTSRTNGWFARAITDAGSEPGSYTFTAPSTGARRIGMLAVIRGALASPLPAGATTDTRGVAVAGGAAVPTFTPTDTNGQPLLVLAGWGADFSGGNTDTPASTPAGWTPVAASAGGVAVSQSRTYIDVRSLTLAAGDPCPQTPLTWGSPLAAVGYGIALQGLPAADPAGPGVGVADGHRQPARAYHTIDTAPTIRTPGLLTYLPRGYPTVADMLAEPEFFWAHRGGSASWPEHSLHAYTQSALRGFGALEIPLARTLDGVWFGCHDQYLDRVALGTATQTLDPTAMTWAQVQQYQIVVGAAGAPQPFLRLDDLIDAYGGSHILVVDPKYALAHLAEMFDLLDSRLGPQRVVVKYFYDNASVVTLATTRGYTSWGYVYAANLTNPNLAARCAPWTLLGMDWNASPADWATIGALGKPVIAHICANQAAVDTARSRGAAGYMCSGTGLIQPW